LLLPVLGYALRIAVRLKRFEHTPVGKQEVDLVQLKFVRVELVQRGCDFKA
jgi:hypothetical protein